MTKSPSERNRKAYERQVKRKLDRRDKDRRELEQMMWGVLFPKWPGHRTCVLLRYLYEDGITRARPNMGLKTATIIGKLMHGERGWPEDQDPMEGYC